MNNKAIDLYIDRLLSESTPERPLWNIERILQGKKPHWNYIDGCMMTAFRSLYEQTGDKRFARFVDDFIDHYIAEDGSMLGYVLEDYNLDNINEGRVLFDLFEDTGKEKYKRAVELLERQLREQPRTERRCYWHKLIYPHQVWLDGLYMAQPFAVRLALMRGAGEMLEDVKQQYEAARLCMRDPETGLYCHGYDESKSIFWANPETGRSKCFWLRAVGWFMVSLADILDYWRDDSLAAQFLEAAEAILPFMDAAGMFWQVVDQGERPGNYMETSGSAMLAYAFLKGARLGVLPGSYREAGKRVFDGICGSRLSERDGILHLGGICLVAGLGPDDNKRRDGTFGYYISEPVVENEAKGVAPFLLSYTEILRL